MTVDITCIGTGEAFSIERASTSYLIEDHDTDNSILVDCEYMTPFSLRSYLKKNNKSLVDTPDAVLFTHEHGDHFAGLTALLMPMREEINGIVGNNKMGLDRKLTIASANLDLLKFQVNRRMNQDYYGFYEKFLKEGPEISYKFFNKPNGNESFGFNVSSAQTTHGAKNYAYRFNFNGGSFAISGDGAFTDESRELFKNVDLLFHEGFTVSDDPGPDHASIKQVVDYAIENGVQKVAIVHVNRQELTRQDEIVELTAHAYENNVILNLPNDHDNFRIGD